MSATANAIHEIALSHGCAFRTEDKGAKTVTRYSLRDLTVTVGNGVKVSMRTDFVSLKRLFAATGNTIVRELLFEAARPCTHCISDKCTTLLMADARTLALDGRVKKVCSMWGQWPEFNVTEDNLPACAQIVARFLSDAASEKHADMRINNVTYRMTQKSTFYIAGYRMRHTQISPSDEDFVKECLPKMPALCASLGVPDEGRYVGATDNFISGIQYDFLFGVVLDQQPGALPDGAVLRKIRAGEWAVYNFSLTDYPSVWRHYTEQFYGLEKRGFDRARIPFEYYDNDSNWSDVHIPVDADEPEDAGRVITLERRPDYTIAGFENFGELDHPEFVNRGFDEVERIKELFPDWSVIVRGSIHQYYGKPLRGMDGVVIDDYMDVPEGLDRIVIKGGLWRLSGRRHFNGWHQDWNFDTMLEHRMPLNECQHPHAFNEYRYNARGGYSEIGIPMRPAGKTTCETVTLPHQRLLGKVEDPANGKTVPDAELNTYYDLPGNARPGSLIVGFKATEINGVMFYAEPLVKGVLAEADAPVPNGFEEYLLEGGKFVKITETNPDGTPFLTREPGWEVEWILHFPDEGHTEIADYTRHCRMLQTGHGRHYELYVPVQ